MEAKQKLDNPPKKTSLKINQKRKSTSTWRKMVSGEDTTKTASSVTQKWNGQMTINQKNNPKRWYPKTISGKNTSKMAAPAAQKENKNTTINKKKQLKN